MGTEDGGGGGGWFLAWLLVGAALALGVLSMLSIGIFVLPPAIVAAALLPRHQPARASAAGLIAGLGLPVLYVGYLNREGPGTVCHSTAVEQSCVDESSPWPWLAIGLALVAVGIGLHVWRRSAGHRAGQVG